MRYTPEIGDTVDFEAIGEYGHVSGTKSHLRGNNIMSRSTYTNALIRKIMAWAKDDHLYVFVNDGEEMHRCRTFREVADTIDSVDESEIILKDKGRNQVSWFYIILQNDDMCQLSDYTANDLTQEIVKSVTVTGDE